MAEEAGAVEAPAAEPEAEVEAPEAAARPEPAAEGDVTQPLKALPASRATETTGLRGTLTDRGTIIIRGQEHEMHASPLARLGEDAEYGVTLTAAELRCPLPRTGPDGVQATCDTWIELELDFGPSAWLCPVCGGLVVVDDEAERPVYADCDQVLDVAGDRALFLFAQDRLLDLGQKLQLWVSARFDGYEPLPAAHYADEDYSAYDDAADSGSVIVFPRFVPLDQAWLEEQWGLDHPVYDIMTIQGLDNLVRTSPDGSVAHVTLPPGLRRLRDRYATGVEAMQAGDLDRAIRVFRRLVLDEPGFVAARVNLANCLVDVGKPLDALQELEDAREAVVGDTDVHLAAARAYDGLGDRDSEMRRYEQVLKIDPRHLEALINLGALHRTRGQLKLANDRLSQALDQIEAQERSGISDRSQALAVHRNLAMLGEAQADWDKATHHWKVCTRLDPDDEEAQQGLQRVERARVEVTAPIAVQVERKEPVAERVGARQLSIAQIYDLIDAQATSVEEAGGESVDPGVLDGALKWLASRQKDYQGEAYFVQIERNAVYMREAALACQQAIVLYLCEGQPLLGRDDEVSRYVALQRRLAQHAVPFQLNFIRYGCTGCEVHDRHAPWTALQAMRRSVDRAVYLEELEFSCIYGQVMLMASRYLLVALLNDRKAAGIAQGVPSEEVALAVDEGVSIRTDEWSHLAKLTAGAGTLRPGLGVQTPPWRQMWGERFQDIARRV
jgi:tetratricopeptide (TPR) repeat protein